MRLLRATLFLSVCLFPCIASAADQDDFHPSISAKNFVDICEPSLPALEKIVKQKGDTQGVSEDDIEALTVCTSIMESVDAIVSIADHYTFNNGKVQVVDQGLSKPDLLKEVIRYAKENPYLDDPQLPAAALVLFAMADYAPEADVKLYKCGGLYTTNPSNKAGCVPADQPKK